MGKKSGKVGLNPSHSSSWLPSCGNNSFAQFIIYLILFFEGGFFNPHNSTVPTARKPWFIGVMPNPLSRKITGLEINLSLSLK